MFRRSLVHPDSFRLFGNTRVGQELALRTKHYMNDLNKGSRGNPITRFLSRRRTIDRMQVEVDDHITQELHHSFEWAMKLWTMLVVTPVIAGLFAGKVAPTRFMVWFGITTQERYDAIWEFAHIGWILLGQACCALLYYDLSVYWRYPVYKYAFAPIWRKMGWTRPAPVGTANLADLKSGAARRRFQEELRRPGGVAGAAKKGGGGQMFGAKASFRSAAPPKK